MGLTGEPTGRTATDHATATGRTLLRVGAVSIVLGTLAGLVVSAFHGGSEPGDLAATLPVYAANRSRGLVHLGQFLCDLLLLVGLVALYQSINEGLAATVARLGIIVAVVAEGVYAANQAVDGIAIQFVAQQWVSAPPAEQAVAFRIADAV